MRRTIFNLFSFSALFWAPWTVVLILLGGGLVLFRNFWEAVGWALIYDLIFGRGTLVFTLIVLVFALLLTFLRSQLLVDWSDGA